VRIGVLLPHGFFPGDIRVEKEVRVLSSGGHSVHVLCRGRKTDAASDEALGARIERMRYGELAARASNLVLKMTGYRYHPLWNRHIKRFIKANAVEAIHTHDLGPALMGCNFARRFGIPVVADLHDDYPTMNAEAVRTLSSRAFNSIRKIARIQGEVATRADRVIITSPKYLELFPERYGISPDKMVLVPNYQDLDTLVEPESVEPIGLDPDSFTITFVGSIGTPGRGVQVAIEAMPQVLERMPDTRLVIVGSGGYLPQLKALAARLGLEEQVEFTGQVEFSKVPGYIAASDVCIITFLKEKPQYNLGNPHKLFQYMAARKPILVSDCYETSRHVLESGAGLVFASGDTTDFADKLETMRSAELRGEMGEKGYKAVRERYNFESLSDRILSMYGELERKTAKPDAG
jgi:glycosyltransferase involved in cell wall biosynthesis